MTEGDEKARSARVVYGVAGVGILLGLLKSGGIGWLSRPRHEWRTAAAITGKPDVSEWEVADAFQPERIPIIVGKQAAENTSVGELERQAYSAARELVAVCLAEWKNYPTLEVDAEGTAIAAGEATRGPAWRAESGVTYQIRYADPMPMKWNANVAFDRDQGRWVLRELIVDGSTLFQSEEFLRYAALAAGQPYWETVGMWRDMHDRLIPQFMVRSRRWRVSTVEPSGSVLGFIYDAKGNPVGMFAGPGPLELDNGPGTFSIRCRAVGRWTLKVEDHE